MKQKIERYALEILIVISAIGIICTLAMEPETETSYLQHTIQTGETVWEIAEKYSDRQRKPLNEFVYSIQQENTLTGRYIHPGDVLVIPLAVPVQK